MAPPREQSVAKPLIQPWRDIEILVAGSLPEGTVLALG